MLLFWNLLKDNEFKRNGILTDWYTCENLAIKKNIENAPKIKTYTQFKNMDKEAHIKLNGNMEFTKCYKSD